MSQPSNLSIEATIPKRRQRLYAVLNQALELHARAAAQPIDASDRTQLEQLNHAIGRAIELRDALRSMLDSKRQ